MKDNHKLEGTLTNFDKNNDMLLTDVIMKRETDEKKLGLVYVNGRNLISVTNLKEWIKVKLN